MLFSGCQKSTKVPEESIMQTYVAATIEADSIINNTEEKNIFVMFTPTPGPTFTPVHTLIPRNIIGNIIDDIRLNEYCNQELVPEIIKKFRLIDESISSIDEIENLDFFSNKIFETEENQQLAIENIKPIIKEVESIKVPECLESAKAKILLGYEEILKVFERNDENWFSDLMAAGFLGQSGRDELDRIEQCLPTGCN